MLLAADIGNAFITLGVHNGATWRAHWQIRSDPARTGEEYGLLLEGLLGRAGVAEGVTRLAVASAVPALVEVFRELGEAWLCCPVLVVGPGVRTGLSLRVDHPSEVGPDLVANAVAVYARFGDRCVAVDFGTATSLVAVVPPGALVGVVLAPGLRAGAEGLTRTAAQLPHVPLAVPPRVLGKNTVHAIQAGVVLGHGALVSGLLQRIREELGPVRAVATGRWAPLVAPLCPELEAVDPYLTLEGIRLIAARNP